MRTKNAVTLFFILVIVFAVLTACQPIDNDPSLKAQEYIGLDENIDRNKLKELVGVDPARTEWCAAFVNAVLDMQDIPGSESVSDYPLMARSFLEWGEKVEGEPQKGDIVIFPRGDKGWQGHVGFFIRDTGKAWVILGGNQDNTVNYSLYDPKKVIAIRRYIFENNGLQTEKNIIE